MDPEKNDRIFVCAGVGTIIKLCEICDMEQTLYLNTTRVFVKPLKKYSPETITLSNDIAWNQALVEKRS